MNIEQLQELASSYKAVTEDIKWENHLCFSVGAKMFLLTSPDEIPVSACFKVSEEDFDELFDRDGFRQAPHFAKRKWIYLDDINGLSNKEWEIYLQRSYESVVAKLTKKLRSELGI